MKSAGIWHPRLAHLVAGLGHGETLVVADPGLPQPVGPEVVDLVFAPGAPRLIEVVRPILSELVVEGAAMAHELHDQQLLEDVAKLLRDVEVHWMSHDDLKFQTADARVLVRTGECTPYANLVLTAGVPF